MRVGFEALDVSVPSEVHEAVSVRSRSSVFAGVQDLRVRLRRTGEMLLCVAMVGFAGGELVTATATSSSALGAVVDALDGLPGRIHRMQRIDRTPSHAAVRAELMKLLSRR